MRKFPFNQFNYIHYFLKILRMKGGVTGLDGRKIYLHSFATVINAVNDLIEMQKGIITLSDTQNGRIHYAIQANERQCELRFAVVDIGYNRSSVNIETDGGDADSDKLIRHEFSLLGAMLDTETDIEIENLF